MDKGLGKTKLGVSSVIVEAGLKFLHICILIFSVIKEKPHLLPTTYYHCNFSGTKLFSLKSGKTSGIFFVKYRIDACKNFIFFPIIFILNLGKLK